MRKLSHIRGSEAAERRIARLPLGKVGLACQRKPGKRLTRRYRTGIDALSPREFTCLSLLGAGRSLQECAREMHVSVSTASTYRSRILEKLDLKSTAEIIRFALEHELTG